MSKDLAWPMPPFEFSDSCEPGRLEANAFRGGDEPGRQAFDLEPKAIRLIVEESVASAERGRLTHLRIEVMDASGRRVPGCRQEIHLMVSGPAKLIEFGGANLLTHSGLRSNSAETHDGQALAILQARGTAGIVQVTAQGAGLRLASLTLYLKNPAQISHAPESNR